MKLCRSLAVGIALTSLGLATACSTGGSTDSGGNKSIDLFVASAKTPFKTAAKDFEKQHPGTTINFSYAPTDSYVTTMRTRLASGNAPDVFYVYPGHANTMSMQNIAEQGYLADLSDRPWVKRLPGSVSPMTQHKNKTYILPMGYDAIGALYNVGALKKVGASTPKTWSQLLHFCKAAKSKGKVAFALGNQTQTDTQFLQIPLVTDIVYSKNPKFAEQMKSGKATFAGSGWEEAYKKYLAMRDHGCFNNKPNGTSYDQAVEMVATGKAIAFAAVTNSLGALRLKNDKAKFSMFPVPATDDASGIRLPANASIGVGINAKTKNPKLAKEFVDFLAKPKNMNKFVEANGDAPSIPNKKYEPGPGLQVVKSYRQKGGRTVQWPGRNWPNAKVQPVELSGIQDLFAGKVTPHQLCKKMDQAYQSGP